jgi:hypothetical protein
LTDGVFAPVFWMSYFLTDKVALCSYTHCTLMSECILACWLVERSGRKRSDDNILMKSGEESACIQFLHQKHACLLAA